MKNALRIFVPGLMALSLMACSRESLEYSPPAPASLDVYGGVGALTKASDRTWSEGDMIGVTALTSGMSDKWANACYALDGGATTSGHFTAAEGHTVYLGGADEVTFTAYAPYQGTSDAATLPGEDGLLSGISTAVQSEAAEQEAIDFLFASETSADASKGRVNFTFSHVMSKLVVEIVAGEGVTAEEIQDEGNLFSVGGLYHSGSFCVTDGTAGADTSSEAVESWDLASNSVAEYTDEGIRFTAIIFPQGSDLTFSTLIGSQEYDGIALEAPEEGYASGWGYTYTVTVNAVTSGSASAPERGLSALASSAVVSVR